MIRAKGWDASAQAWIDRQGQSGDWSRTAVLDGPMLRMAREVGGRFVDIGCGEGRFVRMLAAEGMTGVGVDPTAALIARARECDPHGDYRIGSGEALPMDTDGFDFAVSYLVLCDIADYRTAITEICRVIRPGGSVLVANTSGFNSAGTWTRDWPWRRGGFVVDNYMVEGARRERWCGIDIVNYHRPLSAYLTAFLGEGLVLREFIEPLPRAGAIERPRHNRVPWFTVMRWDKPQR